MIHVAQSFFGVRFNYLRWRRFLETGEAPTFADIGRAVGRTGPAVGAWVHMQGAPTDYRLHGPLLEFFELESDAWLIKDQGEAPDPELYRVWLQHQGVVPILSPKPTGVHSMIDQSKDHELRPDVEARIRRINAGRKRAQGRKRQPRKGR